MSTNQPDHDKVINSTTHGTAWAAIDAKVRSETAFAANPFFSSAKHQGKINKVLAIIDGFFPNRSKIYINHRENRGKPFTTIKVERPAFPRVSQQRKNSEYLDPLRQLGVEIIFSPNTNSYIDRVS